VPCTDVPYREKILAHPDLKTSTLQLNVRIFGKHRERQSTDHLVWRWPRHRQTARRRRHLADACLPAFLGAACCAIRFSRQVC